MKPLMFLLIMASLMFYETSCGTVTRAVEKVIGKIGNDPPRPPKDSLEAAQIKGATELYLRDLKRATNSYFYLIMVQDGEVRCEEMKMLDESLKRFELFKTERNKIIQPFKIKIEIEGDSDYMKMTDIYFLRTKDRINKDQMLEPFYSDNKLGDVKEIIKRKTGLEIEVITNRTSKKVNMYILTIFSAFSAYVIIKTQKDGEIFAN